MLSSWTASTKPPRLSKSRFTAGLQCHKMLWWRVHDEDAPAPDPQQQALFDQGAHVGEVAREYVSGGVLIDFPHDQYEKKVVATREAIAAGAKVIYEASFFEDGVFVAVDILEKTRRGWRVIEVKSSTRVKEQHLPDLAVQVHVIRESGLEVDSAQVMFLNRECRFPDLSNLFVREELIDEVEMVLPGIGTQIRAQRKMLAGPLPIVETGDHCEEPYECAYLERCHAALPDHHVSTLYRVSARRVRELVAAGYEKIADLPDDLELHDTQERQRLALQTGETVLAPGLAEALAEFDLPIAFLDFETVAPAIPVWENCGPYSGAPVQFSCHVLDADGAVRHFEWIAEGPEDPRPALATALLEATRGVTRVVAYNAGFEEKCIRGMAGVLPKQARALNALAARLIDLLPVVRKHVYHPDFGGGFGLKAVLPAMVPGLDYSDLEIAEGNLASVELARLMFQRESMTAMSGRSLQKVFAVIDAASANPAQFAPLLEEMDRTGKIDGAFRRLKQMKKPATAPKGDTESKLPDDHPLIQAIVALDWILFEPRDAPAHVFLSKREEFIEQLDFARACLEDALALAQSGKRRK